MSAVVAIEEQPISAATMESVLGTGDLSKLTTQQRVEYYAKVCQAIGVNPLTRPFRFMQFQGNTVLYATRDLTDQLRQLRKINLAITDKCIDGELYVVTAQASTPDGRKDEDVGAVTLGQLRGDARANAIMKAMTKAKRRVTLSICGLGFLDESEVETLPGAMTFDAEASPPPPPARAAAIAAPRPAAGRARPDPAVYDAPADPLDGELGWEWLRALKLALRDATSRAEVVRIGGHPKVGEAIASAPEEKKREISDLLADAYGRFDGLDTGEAPEADAAA